MTNVIPNKSIYKTLYRRSVESAVVEFTNKDNQKTTFDASVYSDNVVFYIPRTLINSSNLPATVEYKINGQVVSSQSLTIDTSNIPAPGAPGAAGPQGPQGVPGNVGPNRGRALISGLTHMTLSSNHSFPSRIQGFEPNRKTLIIQNVSTVSVDVAHKADWNADFNGPSAANWTAGVTLLPGEEFVSADTRTISARPTVAGQNAAVNIYVEMVTN